MLLTECLWAQAVIFPQQQQAGVTQAQFVLSQGGHGADGTYTLSNDLLSASYECADGLLTFAGAEALGLKAGTDLFAVRTADGNEMGSSQMTLRDVRLVELPADPTAARGALHDAGKALEATFATGTLELVWRAVLRDGSHYLRTELELTALSNTSMQAVVPMRYVVSDPLAHQAPTVVGNTRGAVIASDRIFAGLETPMGQNSVGGSATIEAPFAFQGWTGTTFAWTPAAQTPQGILDLGFTPAYISGTRGYLAFRNAGRHTVQFQYTTGSHRLDVAGVDVLDPLTGQVVAADYHKGTTGGSSSNNTYVLDIPSPGYYLVRYFRDCTEQVDGIITGAFSSNGTITWSGSVSAPAVVYDGGESDLEANVLHLPALAETPIEGVWSRQTTLQAGQTWQVSAVVGLIAPGQARRSFLAYSERERAVPWRPFPIYNSWFELNIDRNNDPNYTTNFNEAQCLDVLAQWQKHLFEPYGVGIASFVWDDGWDQYGTWTFNKNFPNGFSAMSDAATDMDSHIGAWLGPVGGYGQSGNYRRAYWQNRGGMQLSNKAYYDTFLNACTYMVNNYRFNYFKFDGISAQFSAVGPDAGATGEENAEAIIDIERRVREVRPDVFLNTTVGTWASPFWFQFTDAVWRQENDFGTIGNQGTDRERWITYRDRLVYQNFVQNSPLCPINSMMTHGFILTDFGNTATDRNYDGIVRELRCAFACGSGQVELYADYALLNSIKQGALWGEVAECIKWQRRNADVLPDVHWVGGNPWDGQRANVYGWAAWNGKKCTLCLRNPSVSTQTFKTTLRKALDIPDYIHTQIYLTSPFTQKKLSGIGTEIPIDIDLELTLRLSPSSVYVYDGVDVSEWTGINAAPASDASLHLSAPEYFDLQGRRLLKPSRGITITGGRKILVR